VVSLPNARPRYDPNRPKERRPKGPGLTLRDDLLIYAGSFVLFMAAAAYFFYVIDVFNQDALSRTMDAHNVLYSRDPHLGAIGLAWPPIPTFLRVMLLPITSRVGLTEFTGPITSVIATAGCVVLLNRILANLGVGRWTRGVWIAATMANPVLLYHFVNGTAESLFTFFFLWVLLASLQLRERPEAAVLGMGFASGLALWVRYEALAIVGTAVLGYLLVAYVYRKQGVWRDFTRFESLLVTLLFPTAALGILWLSFNWTMQGDPLFFYHGPYSINAAPDVAKNAEDHALRFALGNPVGTVQYVMERALQMSFLYPTSAAAVMIVGLKRRDMTGPLLALLVVSTVLMQTYQTYTGTIAPWLRYWVYLPLFTPILLGWLGRTYPFWLRGTSLATAVRLGIIPACFLLANLIAYQTMGHEEVGADEQLVVAEIDGDADRAADLRSFYPDREVLREVAAYLETTEGLILLDVQKAAVLLITFDEADRFAINTDRDFGTFLDRPFGNVDYLLLPNPRGKGVEVARDAIYTRHGDLYDGAAWLALDREFEGEGLDWRLFRVVDPDSSPPPAASPAAP